MKLIGSSQRGRAVVKNIISFLVPLAFASLYLGCASQKEFASASAQTAGVGSFYRDGQEILVSERPASNVILGLRRIPDKKQFVRMLIVVENKSTQAFNFDPERSRLTLHQGKNDKRIAVYPPSQAINKLTFDRRLVAMLNGMAAAYNAGAGIQSQNAEIAASNAALARLESMTIEESLLKTNTILPGETVAGFAYFPFRSGRTLSVELIVGEDRHIFMFDIVDD